VRHLLWDMRLRSPVSGLRWPWFQRKRWCGEGAELFTGPGMSMEVILVHGLWYGPWAMAFLARQLRREGHKVRRFSYRPAAWDVAAHARQLARFTRIDAADVTHFVAHSLGGLVVLDMLANEPGLTGGRVVLLGTPLQGSRTARRVLRLPGGKALLGQVAADLSRGLHRWPEDAAIGMIAGSVALGLGRLVGWPEGGGDGTVGLDEADAPDLTGRVVLPVSHTGMLFSSQVARQVSGFLQNGHFPAAG